MGKTSTLQPCRDAPPLMQAHGVHPELLAHMSPAQSDNIGLFDTITVDIDAEVARLDPTEHRLRNDPHATTPST